MAGKHDVGELGGVGQEHVLHHEVLEPAQQLAGPAGVGLRAQRVLADDVAGGELAPLHGLEHQRQVPAALGRDRRAVNGLEPGPGVGVGLDVLEPGQLVGDRPHVAAALHVVLAAQRDQPGAVPAHVAGEQGQVDQREHVVGGVVVLGDAQGPADLRPVGPGIVVRQLPDEAGGHAGVALGPVQRVRLHGRRVGLEAGRGPLDELSFTSPASMISRPMAFASEMSEPTSMPSHASAHCADVVRRGSTAYSRAPVAARPSARGGRRSGALRARSTPT